jgi:hypothetical protein
LEFDLENILCIIDMSLLKVQALLHHEFIQEYQITAEYHNHCKLWMASLFPTISNEVPLA